jgi:hypothetical protein
MGIRKTWGSGGWQRNARCRVVFVCGKSEKSGKNYPDPMFVLMHVLKFYFRSVPASRIKAIQRHSPVGD